MKLFNASILAFLFSSISIIVAHAEDIYTCKFTQGIMMFEDGSTFRPKSIGTTVEMRVSPSELMIQGFNFSENEVWIFDYYFSPNDWSVRNLYQIVRYKENILNYVSQGSDGGGGTIKIAECTK
ncbi:hypothetical protein N8755_05440, partial [Alphaproteobacteria bacterium]|nr:hypothetical protein [Alphaproteobacteria bacterium]